MRVVLSIATLAVVVAMTGVAQVPGQPPGTAADANVPDEVTDRIEAFFRDISADRARQAYDGLLAGSPLARQTAAVDNLLAKTPELKRTYGELRDVEQVAAAAVGDDVLVLDYLYKCESFPVAWHFTLYRAPTRSGGVNGEGQWVVVAVRFDTEIEALASR